MDKMRRGIVNKEQIRYDDYLKKQKNLNENKSMDLKKEKKNGY